MCSSQFPQLAPLILALLTFAAAPAQTTQPIQWQDAPEPVCRVTDPRIRETSGLAASRRYPGLYYVHNDSGDKPRLFLIDRTGRVRAEIRLRNARAVDYEDIALAPGSTPGTFDVCVADTGDNFGGRDDITIYRFPEPDLPAPATVASPQKAEPNGPAVRRPAEPAQPIALITVEPTAYAIGYPGARPDAEAFCVHPATGDGYIIAKQGVGPARVYKLPAPWNAQRPNNVTEIARIDLPVAIPLLRMITAADIAPDGLRLALRTYAGGWELHLSPPTATHPATSYKDDSARDFDRIFTAAATSLPLPVEQQAEALTYSATGDAILTLSEGRNRTLYELRAEPRRPPVDDR